MDTEAMKQALREAIGITDEQTEPAAQPQKETRQEQPAYTPPQPQPQTPIKTFDIPLQEATDIAENSDVLYWDGTECGSVETGQEVVVRWFYDSFPSDESKFLDYFDPDSTQWVWIDVDLDNEIEDWISGGFVPADALDIDEYLILP